MFKQIKLVVVVVVARFFECHQCCVGLASVAKKFSEMNSELRSSFLFFPTRNYSSLNKS